MEKSNIIVEPKLRVLILEDSPLDYELMCNQLQNSGFDLDITHADNRKDFEMAVYVNKFDIILSDFNLPGFDAFGALKFCNKFAPETPFVCVSGSIGEETAIELLKIGAVDYVLKDRPERLPFAIRRALDEAKEKLNHKKAAKALQESEFRFKQVAEEAQEWIWEVDKNGLYTYSSPVVTELLGYLPAEIVGKKHFFDFFTPEFKDSLKEAAMNAFERRSTFRNFHNPNTHKSGQTVILSTSGSPVYSETGEFLGYRGVDSDVTEQTRTLEALVEAKERAEESDRLKTAFLQNLSHEIRTPMNGVIGFMELLNNPDLSSNQRIEYTEIVEKSATRLINTINEIIEISKIETKTVKVNLSKENPEAIIKKQFVKYKNQVQSVPLNFNISIPEETTIDYIETDIHKLDIIFNSLIVNAIKFTTSGSIEIGFKSDKNDICFFVKDTGVGIPADRYEAIFKPFVQANLKITRAHEGSGLGLSIAKAYVEMLKGRIWFDSSLEDGTSFYFTLPL
jgi:PAS domain S-box-containing protein